MLGWLLGLFCQPSKPVNTRDEALNIAQTAIRQKWPNYHNSEDEPSLWYDEKLGVWHFRYFTKHESDEPIFGGIGPGVDIRGSDGKILRYLKGQK